jgi:glycosyltransferase involved in cell wall biosynthesis
METEDATLPSVCVVGCAKNIGPFVEKTMRKMIEIKNCFSTNSVIVIVENDSTDSTLETIKKFSSESTFPGIHIIIITKGLKGKGRTAILAEARNVALDYIRRKFSYLRFMIVMDMDSVCHELDSADIKRLITLRGTAHHPEWDAVFANCGVKGGDDDLSPPRATPYYDIWALRCRKLGIDFDCWEKACGNYPLQIPTPSSIEIYVRKFQKPIEIATEDHQEYLPVQSAFGGLGIYYFPSVINSKYVGINPRTGCNFCEHVSFHENMKNNGFDKLYINTKLLVQTQTEHL